MKNNLLKSIYVLMTVMLVGVLNSCTQVDPAGITFSTISESGFESSGFQTISVNLDKSIGSDVTIEFEYSGTATKSSDYYYNTTEVTIPAGSTSADISFTIYDNYEYDPTDKTIIINLTTISGPGVEDVKFGDNTTFTYTLQEDDMQIDLTWIPTSGSASDHDIDLYVNMESSEFRYSSSVEQTTETVFLYGDDTDATYYAIAHYYSGAIANADVAYSITLNFPDGSTQTHSDTYTSEDIADRTLWGVTKSGTTYSASQDPFGSNGRVAMVVNHTK